ncbi:unnamed protein product [Parascedosporium putredinis]|uniref:Uncharacterized protein n=1 Tax=Parascedosporium putredinis TaxID=1442378 RepID=A0A9P1MDN5_9PEZI|nr:unnamed protein product [Parascedosporium putredinis]CAI8004011.1 unnamed protein product [Parascedosporium putredinis]
MSGYSYSGRSHGAGGSVGIANLAGVADPRYFVFREPGIRTTVSCSKDPSSNFAFSCRPTSGGVTCQANTIRTLPEGRSALSGPTFGGNWIKSAPLAGDIMTWGNAYENRTTWFSLAAAGCADVGSNCDLYGFAEFDKAQCLLSFEGAELEVGVNVTSRMITVTPVAKADWPSYGDDLLEELAAEHNYISYNDGTWSGSQMGHALRSNLDSFEVLRRQLTNEAKGETTMLRSLEDFFGDLMDNSLIAYAQSKYLAEHSEQVVQATVTSVCGGRGLASYVKMHNAQALENGEDSRSGVSAAAGETRLRVETANGGTSALVLEEYVTDVFGNDKIVDRSSETVYIEAGRSLMKSSNMRGSAEQR